MARDRLWKWENHSGLLYLWEIAEYREIFGKQVTLLSTFAYLTPLCLNWLMTVHRVAIFLFPLRSRRVFSDLKTAGYCAGITVALDDWEIERNESKIQLTVLISLLIPYHSSCSLNFYSPTNTFISACGSGRHPVRITVGTDCINVIITDNEIPKWLHYISSVCFNVFKLWHNLLFKIF